MNHVTQFVNHYIINNIVRCHDNSPVKADVTKALATAKAKYIDYLIAQLIFIILADFFRILPFTSTINES
jgi:hypothetical protein